MENIANNVMKAVSSSPDITSAIKASASLDKAKSTGEDFEAMFLAEMLNHMFSDIKANDLTGDKESEEVYQSMMVQEYGKIIARSGGIGVADYVTKAMLQTQEVTP